MPIFSKLFEILPDAEHLLILEPEELADHDIPIFYTIRSIHDASECRRS